MKHIVAVVVAGLIVIGGGGAVLAASGDAVLATVGDLEITAQEVTDRIQQMPPQYKQAYATEAGRAQLLAQMVKEKLVYFQAKKDAYDTNADVLAELERIKTNLMVRQYIRDTFSKLTVEESELTAYYDNNKAQFTAEEEVGAKHILCKTQEEAEAARQRVLDGEAFADVAKDVSACPSKEKGGDLGMFKRGQMVQPFETAAFGLEKGGMSDPVQTKFGFHIITVYEKTGGGTKSFEEVREDLEQKVAEKKQQQYMDDLIEKLKTEYPVTVN
ncbi:MAG TPA: peptidylprolyl isomerase [Desulfobacteraceae bacterium]|nr:peptidylprolyl isomerase [Desulfobacteraceae bacterium]